MKTHSGKIDFLVKQLSQKSDERALNELFHLYYDRLLSHSFSLLKNKSLAEEVVADVFFQVWKKRAKLHKISNLDNYLFVSIRNQSLNYINSEQKIKKDSIDDFADNLSTKNTIEDLIFANELQLKITKSINQLPPKCKEIFMLVRFEGLKYKEVAQQLHISVHTVDNQMGIALKKLSEMIYHTEKKKKK